ncbi:hypothetical protein [Pedobacter sp. Leaf132]|uniref:hypothetical protein n=1 Tax=Pedobacter sp. Leaf132 TaxID=2876557 RepID=UPI001E2E597C|nr:hypothetical protein [Pedobacter sp. Leaf132]
MMELPKKKQLKSNGVTRYIFLALAIALGIWIISSRLSAFLSLYKSTAVVKKMPQISDTYKEVFPNYDNSEITPSYTFYSAYRAPRATFKINHETENILVYELSVNKPTARLADVIKINWNTNISNSYNYIYDGSYRSANFVFSELEKNPTGDKNLFINISGKLLHEGISNDTIQCRTIDITQLGGRYTTNGAYDFLYKKTDRLLGREFSIELAFIKKNSKFYMLILSPTTTIHHPKQTSTLFNLLTKNK